MRFSVIVPTLNEASYISRLLDSLRAQTVEDFQVIVVDGGSADGTPEIARSLGARVFILDGSSEFAARNYGAKHSDGSTLIFTCADVVFPPPSLEKIESHLRGSKQPAAITGPDIPYDGNLGLRFVYSVYNLLRFLSSRLPYPMKSFSTSTNFLAIRREAFDKIGGFRPDYINADGKMGRSLAEGYRTLFDNNITVYVSARRARAWGIHRFVLHYLYVLENFLPSLSTQLWFESLRTRSSRKHKELHSPKKD